MLGRNLMFWRGRELHKSENIHFEYVVDMPINQNLLSPGDDTIKTKNCPWEKKTKNKLLLNTELFETTLLFLTILYLLL